MAQFYTLEESAERLSITPEEFKRRLKLEWTSIRPFRDGSTLRFRAADIDELARSLGAASDPGLELAPPGASVAESGDSSEEMSFPNPTPKSGTHYRGAPKDEAPLDLSLEDEADSDFALPLSDSGVGSSKSGKKTKGDSDVRLEKQPPPVVPDPEDALPTEEISLDLSGPGSGIGKSGRGSSKISAPRSGTNLGSASSNKIPGATSSAGGGDKENTDSSSEFELSLDADSDSFELQMHTDSSDEVDLGSIGIPPEDRGSGGQSGINLGKPSDSGVSLEKKGPKTGPLRSPPPPPADDDDDLSLTLDDDSSSNMPAMADSSDGGMDSEDASSEFELTLDDSSSSMDAFAEDAQPSAEGGDIFETDFELPVVEEESGSEVVEVDETDLDTTGFEVDASELDAPVDDESASEVVLVDDETELVDEVVLEDDDADVLDDVELEDEPSASAALRGVPSRRRDDFDDDDDRMGPSRTVVLTPPKWGALPAIVLLPCFIILFLGSLMGYEAVRSMWGYHQPSQPSGMLIRGMADTFGMTMVDAKK
jgi:hypothetical protein